MKIPANSEMAQRFKDNEDLLKRMNHGLEKKIASKEQEIKQVDELYDKKLVAAKTEGEREYIQGLERNNQRLVGETKNYEEKMQGYKDQLKKAQDTVEKEQEALKGSHRDKLADLKDQMETNYQDQYLSSEESQREIQSSTQDAVKEIATKSKIEKMAMESNAQYEINALSSEFNQKAATGERNFREKLDNDVRLHNMEVERQKSELKKMMTMDAEKNKRLSDEKNRVHKDQLSFQDKHQQEMLKQRESDFKVRYERMVKEHDEILNHLKTTFAADVKKMVDQTSSEKKQISDKVADPFYRVDKLNPSMVEDLETVTISLPVADHEKENVHLSTQGRNIKITLSRKYSDSTNGEDGSMNRSTRSELFSKEFNAKDLLSPKHITQNYQDGVLTFKIKKA
ncbi:hypothetical protein C0V70_08825 [Bacteriovorax stolpii]|uniref:Uncharacterized protein n=1 Tax=Bacteriovorax stolpii TaxID=960 RepID=A0A2K9NRQ1_BACTC|nr:Hsp20 family protein [Bacteriovorax stolpii]AUN98206.1 hypothetical protein C0V70_08825 [Bacteriovorax stolpii]TDP52125.1 hypothetical protein C8D79_2774 [Bacteriovorax stolpii]